MRRQRKRTAGGLRPRISGAFNNISDKIDFTFDHTILNEESVPINEVYTMRYLGYPLETYHLTSKEGGGVNVIHAVWTGNEAISQNEPAGMVLYSGDGQDIILRPADVGTIWEPLKNAPDLVVSVNGL